MNGTRTTAAVSHLTLNDILIAEREKLLFHHERIIFARRAPGQMNGRRRKQGIYSV